MDGPVVRHFARRGHRGGDRYFHVCNGVSREVMVCNRIRYSYMFRKPANRQCLPIRVLFRREARRGKNAIRSRVRGTSMRINTKITRTLAPAAIAGAIAIGGAATATGAPAIAQFGA